MNFRSARLLIIAAVAFVGCHQRRAAPGDESAQLPAEIHVKVENRNLLDVMIYIQHGGMRSRVGLATAASNSEFRISLAMIGAGGDYRLIGDPVGMRINVSTEMLHARPGDEVTWSLEDSFARSTVVVR